MFNDNMIPDIGNEKPLKKKIILDHLNHIKQQTKLNDSVKTNPNEFSETNKSKKKKKKRICQHPGCKVKLTLTDYPCRCKLMFCRNHIQNHACTFDYKNNQIIKLGKENPKIEATTFKDKI